MIIDMVRPALGESARPFGNFCAASVMMTFLPIPAYLLIGAALKGVISLLIPEALSLVQPVLSVAGLVVASVSSLSFLSIYVRTFWTLFRKDGENAESEERSVWFAVFPPE